MFKPGTIECIYLLTHFAKTHPPPTNCHLNIKNCTPRWGTDRNLDARHSSAMLTLDLKLPLTFFAKSIELALLLAAQRSREDRF